MNLVKPDTVDSRQNPHGWHAQAVTLEGGATAPNDFCIKSVNSAPPVAISIGDNTMEVNVKLNALPVSPENVRAAVGFIIEADSACATGLAVQLVTSSE